MIKSQLWQKPYNLFLLIAILLIAASFAITKNSMDINLFDTYIIISTSYISILSGLFFLLMWALYKLTINYLFKKYLTWFHVVLTVGALILLIFINLSAHNAVPVIKEYSIKDYVNGLSLKNNGLLLFSIMLFVFGQLLFLINMICGLFKNLHQTTNPQISL